MSTRPWRMVQQGLSPGHVSRQGSKVALGAKNGVLGIEFLGEKRGREGFAADVFVFWVNANRDEIRCGGKKVKKLKFN